MPSLYPTSTDFLKTIHAHYSNNAFCSYPLIEMTEFDMKTLINIKTLIEVLIPL